MAHRARLDQTLHQFRCGVGFIPFERTGTERVRVFGDKKLTTALLDRFTSRSHPAVVILTTWGRPGPSPSSERFIRCTTGFRSPRRRLAYQAFLVNPSHGPLFRKSAIAEGINIGVARFAVNNELSDHLSDRWSELKSVSAEAYC